MARHIGEVSQGFVLHSYPYSETSLILEAFTRTHGRIVFMAKGAKRPSSVLKSVLNPFQPLRFNWFGQADMKTLKTAEHERVYPQLRGATLMSAFYMNELLMKLTHREEAHDYLFDAYTQALARLSGAWGGSDDTNMTQTWHETPNLKAVAAVLRRFELSLLQEIGYALSLTEEAETREPIIAAQRYDYIFEHGPVLSTSVSASVSPAVSSLGKTTRRDGLHDGLQLLGKTLLDMALGDFTDPITQSQSKQLMRRAINHVLGDKTLHTRQLIRDLQTN